MGVHCLITGAGGFIGGHLAAALAQRGYRVTCLVRRDPPPWLRDLPVEFARGDVTDLASLREAVRGTHYVYHLAGLTMAAHPDTYFRVNHQGTVNLLRACRDTGGGQHRFVLVSSQAAAGPAMDGRPLREEDPCRPIDPYGASKLAAEEATAEAARDLPVTVVRPAVVYGPRDRDVLTFFRLIRRGVYPLLGRVQEVSLIHVDDAVRGLVLAAESEVAVGRTYFIANPQPYPLRQLFAWIAQTLGVRPLPVPVPYPLLLAAGYAGEVMGRVRGSRPPFDRAKSRQLGYRSWACDSSRARKELGLYPTVQVPEGLRSVAQWYRSAGWL